MTEKIVLETLNHTRSETGLSRRTHAGIVFSRIERRPVNGNFHLHPVTMPDVPVQLFVKRLADIVCSVTALVILSPILIFLMIAIKMESRGPVFFRQLRTGLNEVPFEILKFRSMYTELCDRKGVRQTIDGDPRVTPLGRVLRRTSLDELPQLWNVLVGDMSLVGPRPHVPDMLAAGRRYSDLVRGYEYRHLMKPGLTGLSQARGLRGPTAHRWMAIRRIVCDVEYVRKFSLLVDVKVIVRTVLNEIRGGTGV